MVFGLFKKMFGTRNDREIKRIQQTYVEKINQLEPAIQILTDDQLKAKTPEFKERLSKGEELNSLLPEAFAVTREVGKRVLGMRHFDVQLLGGIVLHEGKIAEMKTGEGKTLVATLPVYLNALTGKGVHVVTVNEYLARRDSDWMGQIYRFLGLSVGYIYHNMSEDERKLAYHADVTYGTNNEFGFDYLRDNMKYSMDQFVQRDLNFAIVDEVDSILIDEARTPLIISGPAEESTDKYYIVNDVVRHLKKDVHYQVDEKARTASLTEEGVAKVESSLRLENLYDPSNIEMLHHTNQALKAHALFRNEVDYVIKEGQVIIIDEFTGRMMFGRRYSDGLHQALEAKEGVTIENENQTLATITFQNFFRMYKKLGGMTGTADTEAEEFFSTYKLEVLVMPPNKKMIREDFPDVIYRTEREKFNAVVQDVLECHKTGQPVLVGTISIETSEKLSAYLKKAGIREHSVLNAKHHEKEAEIVSQAGQKGAVTIATNMAGRGTDIVLGEGVADLGGLYILGTERHEARRIDNQLRGRAGRQGDNGASRFYLSLEDNLLRIFGSERISGVMEKLGMEEGQPIEHVMVSKAVANAQKKVESHNFDIRKHLLEYDDVMNKQREVLYALRRDILRSNNTKGILFDMVGELIEDDLATICRDDIYPEEWDIEGLNDTLSRQFSLSIHKSDANELVINGGLKCPLDKIDRTKLEDVLFEAITASYNKKEEGIDPEMMRQMERMIMLQVVDNLWKDHLLAMDHLKEGIGLRGYAQKNPLTEYKKEGFEMFSAMIFRIKEEISEYLFKVRIERESQAAVSIPHSTPKVIEHRGDVEEASKPEPVRNDDDRPGRNDPCHCGSGKKFKKCHGK